MKFVGYGTRLVGLSIHRPFSYGSTARDHHFAAVAADTPSFEARPTIQDWDLHEYLLSLWGVRFPCLQLNAGLTGMKTPMGELFDLEELAEICKSLNRYSFFVTSSPLHLINGIASPSK
jgi:hypothetical protein